jgi:hypothetical protein
MRRMSSLPISKHCGLAPTLYGQFGSGRPAAMSSAFHAHVAGDHSLILRLTDEEREELADWRAPTNVILADGTTLIYADAEKELEVCLSPMGWACTADEAISVGHLDFAWTVGDESGHPLAYVADIKKSRWTTVDGPESLQLHAYGLAYAQLRGCVGYCTGIYIPTEGEWIWSKRLIEIGSDEHAAIWSELLAAATHESDVGSTGPHCSNCYARLHCPEWTLPAVLAPTILGPLAAGQVPDPARAADLVRQLIAAEALYAKAKTNLKEWVRRGQLQVIDGDKQWAPVKMTGRVGVDREKLERELGGEAERFLTKGNDYLQFRWINR